MKTLSKITSLKLAATIAALSLHSSPSALQAQTVAENDDLIELAPFSVKGNNGPFAETPMVANLSFVSAGELDSINAINVEDTIKYLPNLNVRKRYIGDTNGVTSIRGQNTWMTGRSLVSVDGILLSNFLQTRWGGSPRWAAVSPDELQYAEIEYGPYSAFKSGNALGGSINFVTRMPESKETTLRASAFSQDFSLYGAEDTYSGYKLFASYGERLGKLSLYAFYNRLENGSHPQSFRNTTALSAASESTPLASGAYLDRDPSGHARITYGDTGSDSLVHDQFKLKARYDLTEDIQAQASIVYWKNDSSQTAPANYLTDTNGETIWSGTYQANGYKFKVNPSHFTVSERQREDILAGLTIGGKLTEGWTFDSTLSFFDVLKDENRASSRNPLDPSYDASYTDSTIAKNAANTAFEGKVFPRIPKWRLNLLGTWNVKKRLSASLGGRYQSHSFNNLDNSDTFDTSGSISQFLVLDARLTYRPSEKSTLSLGVDNLTDEAYFVAHPYPQRTYFIESSLRF